MNERLNEGKIGYWLIRAIMHRIFVWLVLIALLVVSLLVIGLLCFPAVVIGWVEEKITHKEKPKWDEAHSFGG